MYSEHQDLESTLNSQIEEIIVPVHLQELRSMREILPHLIETLRSDVSNSIQIIRNEVRADNAAAVAKEAHGIAGAAGSVGGHRLAAICRELEQKGRQGSLIGADVLVRTLASEYNTLCDALELVSREQ